ncbi:MAG: sigma-54-dependent Fis family transcriptional regulator [Acidobacteriia bacterium]|nr:sigma-54-dependent Fis family transcriptional regulator [Terriglobia bacterium]
MARETFDAVLIEGPIVGSRAQALLEQIQRLALETPVAIRDSEMAVSDALRLARFGAYPVIDPGDDLATLLSEAITERNAPREPSSWGSGSADPKPKQEPWEAMLVGESLGMQKLRDTIRIVSARRCTVLVTGETGTGKEVAARALHLAGPRRRNTLVALNCSAVPEALMEAELFGHVRGAFTGAIQTRIGRFEQAHGGTLFLDEIGDLPLDLQAKLLRVLQEREFQRLGSSETVKVDIRVVAATNCDVAEMAERGRFREDLYYRLNVVSLHVPPLRDRPEDIGLLAEHFVRKICRAEGLPLKALSPDATERLAAFSWPGNVRQLENAIESAVVLSGERQTLSAADFPLHSPLKLRTAPSVPEASGATVVSVPDSGLDYEQTLASIERSLIAQALEKTGGNKKAAAEMLRLKRTTLSAKVRSFEGLSACG